MLWAKSHPGLLMLSEAGAGIGTMGSSAGLGIGYGGAVSGTGSGGSGLGPAGTTGRSGSPPPPPPPPAVSNVIARGDLTGSGVGIAALGGGAARTGTPEPRIPNDGEDGASNGVVGMSREGGGSLASKEQYGGPDSLDLEEDGVIGINAMIPEPPPVPNIKLLDPTSWAAYDRYILAYAEYLSRWGMMQERAELVQFLGIWGRLKLAPALDNGI
ncbi:hypothetical protein HK101_005938, partial [Irineochytrium annulatum]